MPTSAVRSPSWLPALGEFLRRRRGAIVTVQWLVIAFYLVLVSVPAFLPLPDNGARIHDNLVLFAQFIFWGIWWPFVILSMMVFGRAWCGIFCPEGALSELASRHGLGRPVPRWLKWGGWPFVAFALTTIYGQLVSVYEYAQAALLVLGGSTVAAVAVGFVYGRGKRVWCRHLCPASGVFSLLARLAPVHFRVDREKWDADSATPVSVNCAPLVDIRRMTGASECHMCARCHGERNAVALTARSPNREIAAVAPQQARRWDAMLLLFGMIGIAGGAFQWSASPWFVATKTRIAEWLVERDSFTLLQDNAPWWLLTHYPTSNDVFTWLDGLCILGYILGAALLLGSFGLACVWIAEKLLVPGRRASLFLAYSLTPMAGLGIFLGLSALTLNLLRGEGVDISWAPAVRGMLLVLGMTWSAWLGRRMVRGRQASPVRRAGALACLLAAVAGIAAPWVLLFYVW